MHRFEYVTVNICESKELFLLSSEVNIKQKEVEVKGQKNMITRIER